MEIRTGTHVTGVTAAENGYLVQTASVQTIAAGAVVAASGSFRATPALLDGARGMIVLVRVVLHDDYRI
ncbi:hypothetical protein LZG07_16915 [Microbacterium profundi]|uniref:hypothetical protein n=1 Tax=Microbacterium profundi TaxID=450380 RepID=UPI001F46DC21|nr:hypothetical protein [Microbacterium profundi]MCE7483579.1 hypothetical protein [Microbacterium profundi]